MGVEIVDMLRNGLENLRTSLDQRLTAMEKREQDFKRYVEERFAQLEEKFKRESEERAKEVEALKNELERVKAVPGTESGENAPKQPEVKTITLSPSVRRHFPDIVWDLQRCGFKIEWEEEPEKREQEKAPDKGLLFKRKIAPLQSFLRRALYLE